MDAVRVCRPADRLGRRYEDSRDAVYIPTLQKDGTPVPPQVVEAMKNRAQKLGLNQISRAAGMWVLSETDEVQTETIWVAHGRANGCLKKFALAVKAEANQDCAAWEENGALKFTG